MDVVVATDARLHCGPDGVLRSESDGRSYGFWRRYLDVFDSVTVLARVATSKSLAGRSVEGDRVSVRPVPDFRGPYGLARHRTAVRSAVASACAAGITQAYVARVPGMVGGLMTAELRRKGVPHALEVVGDPFAAMRSMSLPSMVAAPFARIGRAQLRRQCAGAMAVAYVTDGVLQQHYPASSGAVTMSYSSVELPDEAFQQRSPDRRLGDPPTVAVVATMSQRYKGHDVLLRALAGLRDKGTPVGARLVGSGRYQPELENLVRDLDLEPLVDFVGQVDTPERVRAELDRCDLYVLPSHTEGLPRALIEAMARGVPCVATAVGGVPELLPETDLVAPRDHVGLDEKIGSVIGDAEQLAAMSRRNFARAHAFHSDVLSARRKRFYTHVRDRSLAAQPGSA